MTFGAEKMSSSSRLGGKRQQKGSLVGGGVEVVLGVFRDPVPFRTFRRRHRPAVERRSLHVDPHAGDVASVLPGRSRQRVARDEEVLLPGVQDLGEEAKRGS